ncbi:HesA/MoeB/ThiF family protein [Vulgatibacter sp.]|uniref:HesA/MoeB/ThiF family protein n=1 Tax=Vulgatibacter sp. TaxID=1971226 RepID=UPI003565D1C9
MLTDGQIDRYARHILLREVGGKGQERLLAASVSITGLAGAGGWLVSWLALAGVGRILVADARPVGPDDVLPLLTAADVGSRRDEAIARAVPAFNPDARVELAAGEPVDLRLAIGLPPGGDAGTSLWLHVAGDEVLICPPGERLCGACAAALRGDPPTATAAALAGSVAGAEALLHLLGRSAGRRALHFRAGEPFRCPHG